MTIEQLGSIGEFISGIAVVVSILYLAIQIRQNTRVVKGATIQAITENIALENRWSSDLGEAFVKVVQNPDSLSDVEIFQMGEWLTTAMSTRQNEFFQYEKGLIDEEVWTASLGVIKTIMSIDFCRFWWESWDKNVLSPRFVTIVDEIVKSSFDWKFAEHFELLKNKSRGNVDA